MLEPRFCFDVPLLWGWILLACSMFVWYIWRSHTSYEIWIYLFFHYRFICFCISEYVSLPVLAVMFDDCWYRCLAPYWYSFDMFFMFCRDRFVYDSCTISSWFYCVLIKDGVSLCVGAPSFSQPFSDNDCLKYCCRPLAHFGTLGAPCWFLLAPVWLNVNRFGHLSESILNLFWHQKPQKTPAANR